MSLSCPRSIVAVALTGLWINASEFFRNEMLLKDRWVGHYESLGMDFPSGARNGAVWAAWGFLFAVAIYSISRRFGLLRTALIAWLMGFVLMWAVAWNLNVLPTSILVYAVPLSLLEVFVGSYISLKCAPPAAADMN